MRHAKPTDLDLEQVRVELDRLVELRFVCPFTPGDERRYASLLAREKELLGRARRDD